jgi:hypothetical protein
VPGARDDLSTFLSLALLSIFVAPSLYWFPAGLPFLRLGETIFHEDFPIACLSRFQSELLRDWPARLARLNASRLEAAAFYLGHIEGARNYGTNVPYLRFPLLIGDPERRRALLAEGEGRRLGISWMYPTSIGAIPELADRLAQKSFPEAEYVASSLVTLPTHPLLSRDDLARIAELANNAMRGASRVPAAALADPSRIR